MPNYLEPFKLRSKFLAKKHGLQLSQSREQLAIDSGFSSFHDLRQTAKKSPRDTRLIMAAFGTNYIDDLLTEQDIFYQLDNILSDELSGAIASTNATGYGIDVIETESYDLSDNGKRLQMQVQINYTGEVDFERPFCGSAFKIKANVNLILTRGIWELTDEPLEIVESASDWR